MDRNFSLEKLRTQPETLQSVQEQCNRFALTMGFSLSLAQVRELTEERSHALRESGRVEFGEGILPQLTAAFCDSPWLTQENCVETLASLQESFYRFKNETTLSDSELLAAMRRFCFEHAHGAVELLEGLTAEKLCGMERDEDRESFYGEDDDER